MRQVRLLSYVLHPPMLDEIGLASALKWFAEGLERRSSIDIELEADDAMERLPLTVERDLFRIVQEGLSNVIRHSGSRKAVVRLTRQIDQALLQIQDFGRGMPTGFDSSDSRQIAGLGILGMRERLRLRQRPPRHRIRTAGHHLDRRRPARRRSLELLSGGRCVASSSMPDWLEPMAATLTEERFTGPEWLFERKFDGIRLLAYKRGGDVELYSRNRLPQQLPAVAAAIARLPVDEVILDGEVTWDGRSGYHVFDILWLEWASRHESSTRRTPRAARRLCRSNRRCSASPSSRARRRGSAPARRLGRGDREAARLTLRASAIEALVEDEVRGVAGARRRRFHRSAGHASRASARCSSATTRQRRFRVRRQARHGLRHASCCSTCAGGWTRSKYRQSPFTKANGLPRLRAHWVRPEIVVQVAFIEWTVHGKLRHPRLLGVAFDQDARQVVRES